MPRRLVAIAIVLSFLGMVRCGGAADALPGLAGRFDLTVHAAGGDHPAWLEVTKGVDEPGLEQPAEARALLVGEAGVAAVGAGMGQIDLLV